MKPESESDEMPIGDTIDSNILMHRDVHFGGQFPIMIDYYRSGGKGVCPAFELSRIETLAKMEQDIGQNLAGVLLTGADAEKIAEAKEAYKGLRDLYEIKNPKSPFPTLIADLILSEEDQPDIEIGTIVAQKNNIVPALMDLIRSDQFYDPLFPGYGLAPALAAKCLGLIGDKRAIIALFESIGNGDFFDDEVAFDALKAIGEPAKQFLLKVITGKPVNEDNHRAALALVHFTKDPGIAKSAWEILKKINFKHDDMIFASYLAYVCEGLKGTQEAMEFKALASNPDIPESLKLDIETITEGWNHPNEQ